MAANYVEIVIKALDSASPDIAELTRKLQELNKTDATVKVKVEQAGRVSQILDKIAGTLAGGTGKAGGGGGVAGFFGAIQNGLNSILKLGPPAIPVLAAIAAAIISIVGLLSAMVASVAAAGAGFAAFGALVYPILSKVTAGVTAIGAATTKVAKDKAWDAIPKALQPAVHTILQIKAVWSQMSDSMLPLAGRIASTISDIVRKLLPLIEPLAKSAGHAIENFLKQVDQIVGSQKFRQFIAQLTSLSGPAMKAIANGLLQVGAAVGQFFKDISASGQGPAGITAIFTALAYAIRFVGAELKIDQSILRGTELVFGFVAHAALIAFKAIGDAALATWGVIARAFAHIPGIGGFFKQWASDAASWQKSFDGTMNAAIGSVKKWDTTVTNMPKVAKLEANISNLQQNLAIARANLLNPELTKTRKAKIEANIDQLLAALARAKAALAALQGYTVTTYTQNVSIGPQNTGLPRAAGGIVGAAAGGVRGALSLVGERGPELIRLPPGSQVWSNPDSRRIMSQAWGGGGCTIMLSMPGPEQPLIYAIMRAIRAEVIDRGGGSAETAFGWQS